MATTDPRTTFEIHVLGGSKGESVVLRLPNQSWGVIDCYATDLTDTSTNPTFALLESNGVEELEFVCLTHPHDDHYRGMSQLLNHFPTRYFWRPAAMSGSRLKWLLELSVVEAKRSNWPDSLDDAAELMNIFAAVRSARRVRQQPLIPKNCALGMQVYPVPVDPTSLFQIWTIAPSGHQIEAYEEALTRCFDNNGRLRASLPHSRHNEISLALLIKFGQTHIVLGGDVEEKAWERTLEEFGTDTLACHMVKVSHHGSTNGYCNGLWKAFGASTKPFAVVTPYLRFGLPNQAALQHISSFASHIDTPCLPATRAKGIDTPFHPRVAPRSRRALSERLKIQPAESPITPGCCSFTFDENGNCKMIALQNDAGTITVKVADTAI